MNKKKALELISNGESKFVPKKFYKDKSFVLAAIKKDAYSFEYADVSLKKDKSMVLAAVKQ